ncbi:CCA tRNA nucleotidyltransferase [Marinoscillum sp. MHG1-6]|uniref:CCA tRNA nucleotidyltransferase n=1 Tax=Marinoscillum sp. MHG1-6 TaxID=2959627 RepID=UPI002157B40B|nr:CCA tRNA nucleotidyltransferase [Marinoscillum sp. MHG1-6]
MITDIEFGERVRSIPSLVLVSEVAKEIGVDTYVVGGFVRDLLLERESKDIDVVCVGSGIGLAKAVSDKIGKGASLAVYKRFGTAAIKYGDWELEFVGARKESYRADSRKPIVEDGTLEDDQNRRDFTINALAISLNAENFGELIDPFGGIEHLEEKLIKTPLEPGITFSDDPLRIMRAIRFASQLGFDIEPETWQAIEDNKERLEIISQERISDELNKIILSKKPSYGFKLLFTSGILKMIFPEMQKLHGVKVIKGMSHKDNFYHTLEVLDNISEVTDDLWLRWSAILHDIAKPATQRFSEGTGWTFHGHEDLGARWVPKIFGKLKLPLNEKMKYVQKLVRLHLRPIALVNEEVTDSAIRRLLYEAGDDINDLMKLCKADITSKNPNKVRRYLANFIKVEAKIKEVEERDHVRNFQPPISGEEIIETFGISPSPVVGEIKNAIKEAVLEGTIHNNYEEARSLMLSLGLSKGLTAISK